MSILDEITAAVDKLRGVELPKAIVLRSAGDAERLHLAFPCGELAGLKVLIDPSIPEDTAYLIIDLPRTTKPVDIPALLNIRPESMVKVTDVW